MNVFYKIIAKIIANRLRPYLSNLISYHQSTFVLGIIISDNYCIATELIHSLGSKTRKKRFFGVKMDMASAYDQVE